MNTLIAVCGLNCSQCEAYIATQTNNLFALERVAKKWGKAFNTPGMTADNIQCDGCMTAGRKIGHCSECKIRLCAIERGLANCSACPDFACEILASFFESDPQAKANLEALR